jgi:hypothetical protein
MFEVLFREITWNSVIQRTPMDKKDAYLPGIRVPSGLAQEFKKAKTQIHEHLSDIGRELVQDFIRISQTGDRIARPARFVTVPADGTMPSPAGSSELQCELIRMTDDGSWILRCWQKKDS